MGKLVYLLVLMLHVTNATVPENSTANLEFKLHKDLLITYNPNIRPVKHRSDILAVNIRVYLKAITAFNEPEQTFSTTLWIIPSWTDHFLTWEPKEYAGIEHILVSSDKVWLPDIAIENSVFRATDYGQKGIQAFVSYDGQVVFWPEGTFTTGCKTNLRRYPFDTQICEIRMSTWLYTQMEVNLTSSDTNLSFYDFESNGAWDLMATDITSAPSVFEGEPYSNIIVRITIKRKYIYALFNAILPTVVLSFLNLMSFHIPAESGEKITYAISMFISLAVFLTVITNELPPSSDGISVLAVFICLELGICAITIIITVLDTKIFFRQSPVQLSLFYTKLVNSLVDDKEGYERGLSWKQVSRTCDTLFFWCLLCAQILTMITGATNFAIN